MKKIILLTLLVVSVPLTIVYSNDVISIKTNKYDEAIEQVIDEFKYFDNLVYNYENIHQNEWNEIIASFKDQISFEMDKRNSHYDAMYWGVDLNDENFKKEYENMIEQNREEDFKYSYEILNHLHNIELIINDPSALINIEKSPSEEIANNIVEIKMNYTYLLSDKGLERDYIYQKIRTDY